MKSLSLEGLRRLMRGNRDKETTQDTHHFRRSSSFKRASLRKSSRKQEKILLPNGLVVKTTALQRKASLSSEERPDDGYSTDGDAGGGSSTAKRRVITYDEWVVAASEDDKAKKLRADDSCPSTLSTNKLSSLDSGVRHSLDSKKRLSIDSTKALNHEKDRNMTEGIEIPKRDKILERNGVRSLSTESPCPSIRLKNILGSPRVAPKNRELSAAIMSGRAPYSVHNTPNRCRIIGSNSQPSSEPSTPGKNYIQRLCQRGITNMTPTQQLRSSFHERERFCAVHGALPESPLARREPPLVSVNSPKGQSRWSSVFSNSILFRSPKKKVIEPIKNDSVAQTQREPMLPQGSPASVYHQRNIFLNGRASPAVGRPLSAQSFNNSPNRTFDVNLNPTGSSDEFGVARAMGGIILAEVDGRDSLTGTPTRLNGHPNLNRQLSYPLPSVPSPAAIVQRQRSLPQAETQSPSKFRGPCPHLGKSSLSPTVHVQSSGKTYHILSENHNMVNNSQFYPCRPGRGLIAALPSISVVDGRSASADRLRDKPAVQQRACSSERPKTPSSSKLSMSPWGRPLSLAFNCAGKNDLLSPCSVTSEASSRGKRKRGPYLLVSRTSRFFRNSVSRKASFISNRALRKRFPKMLGQNDIVEEELPSHSTQALEQPILFVPQNHRQIGTRIFPSRSSHHEDRDLRPNLRTGHVNLLMPLNQPVVSLFQKSGDRSRAGVNLSTLLDEATQTDDEMIKDTSSEPGIARFSVRPEAKPKSAPNSTRINMKVMKNPEVIFRALGISPRNIFKKDPKDCGFDSAKEREVTEILLRKLIEDSKTTPVTYPPEKETQPLPLPDGSIESLVSLVDSVVSGRESDGKRSKDTSRIRRRKSHSIAYPSWKRNARIKKSRATAGDITQKGYEKKKGRLLAPYVSKENSQGGARQEGGGAASPSTRSRRRAHRRVTRNESRYHSEVRQEAVKEALSQYQSRPKNLPLPSKRASVMTARSPETLRHDSDTDDSDDDSITAEGSLSSSGGHSHGTPEVNRAPILLPPPQIQPSAIPPVPSHGTGALPLPSIPTSNADKANNASAGSAHHNTPPHPLPHKQQQPLPPVPPHRISNGEEDERRRRQISEMSDLMRNVTTYSQPPDVTNNTGGNIARPHRDDRISRYIPSQPPIIRGQTSFEGESWRGTGRWKVSSKIQQLLNTLKRPKKRPLPEFYVDDEEDLEIAANPKDPHAPKPEGKIMNSARGEQLVIPAGLPRSVEDAVYRYGSSSGYKAPVATVLDANGKLSVSLTYGKLLSRSQKIAYNLLSRLGGRGEGSVFPGDRVALVYPNNDPITFLCSFYACLQAGLVPVPIEVPISRRDAGSLQIGFLLGSCGVSVALTSEACLKGLPKTSSGDVASFKGWPKLNWFITDHLPKQPKDWLAPPRMSEDSPAYIEYSTDKDGSVKGVVIEKSAMLAHCRTLTSACNYTEGEVAVCVLDFKREVGLWHSMLCSVFNGMHIIFIPYSVMKVNPASWMHMITKFKASIAIVKSRDLHWGLLATKDHKDVNLHSLRLLLVADGANPWSLSSCDQFLAVFQSKGLRPDAICPCASSPESLTVSVRRPGHGGSNAVGRGVLSMQGLSFGVVRVDQENSLTSLTLQDCGHVLPGSSIVVVKLDGAPYLCQTDEVGEICVSGPAVGTQYWGLKGLSNSMFKIQPLLPDDSLLSETITYVRSGLLGFLGPGGLVFVCGSRDGLMTVTGRKHNTDDIIATVLAVEPMKFIYRGRIAVFSHKVLRDERICVIAEQRPDCSEEESFQWMSRVLQAVDSIHQVGIYCLALVPPNHLPKTPLGGIHLSETKKKFLEGALHPANVLLCPHTCVTNLPKPREVHHDVGPASVMVGNLVQGNRLAMAHGRDIGLLDDEDMARRHPQFIAEILKWRATTSDNHEILVLLNSKGQVATAMSCLQLHKKAERVAVLLLEKGHINTGDHVALIYPPGIDLIAAFYGCLYVGAVPVTIRPPHPQNLQSTVNTVRTVVDVSKSSLILSNLSVIKLLKNKEEKFDSNKKWPMILDIDELPKKKLPAIYKVPTPEMIAYLDFSVSTTGMLAGIKMSHAGATSLCLSMKVACELYPSRVVALCLDPYCGLGLALWVLSSVYSGHQSILIPPSEVEANPSLWLTAVSQYKVRDTFCSYGVMELCTKGLGSSIPLLKQRGVNLACVRTCVVVAEERPRLQLTTSFSKLFNSLGLSPRAVSTSFGCRVNVAICLQGAASPDPATVYVDLRSLRHDRVTLVERGAPHSLCIMESGKLLPGTKVVIANPDTKGHCSDSHLGEIWVQSNHNASGYFTVFGDDGGSGDHFNAQLVTGSTGEVYSRTGYLGFLKRTESVQADGELHDAVFVVGALDETIILRGMRYHPIDIESTVMRCHKKISEVAVFTWTNLLVVVVELDGQEYEALDLVPLITSSVLEEHQVIVGVIVVVDPGVVPINSRGEKQRMHLRDGFLADQLDPIYVAYNM